MQLKFLAKPEHLQPWPASHSHGQPRRYIGWQWVANIDGVRSAGYTAKPEGDVVDDAVVPSAHVDDIKKACRDGSLLPGDETTAQACGVAFVKHTFLETGFVPATKPKASTPKE